ncbi:hypothetical protein [Streptomyces sp. CBMA123]|uniref:hypothetical protein n=1 Tax=Streptomyces sp. CBMA123 TaxID=1896313 RepID=UPI00166192B8|nr:hypothetical protein [Streptomyces sp. CBMA123]MBD0693953.1 hypothetical protein [Streptomyces sp. CBMA123]
MSDQDPTRDHDRPVPKDPPVPVETPESRTDDEDGPPLVPEEGQHTPHAEPTHAEPTEPAHEPEPHETPD